jgi:D-alanine-D-alanine ligase
LKIRIGVLFGGCSGEHDVSLMSASSILAHLSPDKYEITPIGITRAGKWYSGVDVLQKLKERRVDGLKPVYLLAEPGCHTLYEMDKDFRLSPLAELDVIFPVLHGTMGEDGTIQGLLEITGLAYVGAGVLGSALGMDKIVFKDIMRACGIPIVRYMTATRKEIETDIHALIKRVEAFGAYPLFTKPANLGSSVGISRCANPSDLYEGMINAARYDRKILIEEAVVNARQLEVAVLGNENPIASVPAEINPKDNFYSYSAKYLDGATAVYIPANLEAETTKEAQNLAIKVFKAIDCWGLGRVDFLMDRTSGKLYVSEINTLPGFTQISVYPKAWEPSGISYSQLLDRLIELALEIKSEKDKIIHQYDG